MNAINTKQEWLSRSCSACEGGVEPMAEPDIRANLEPLDGWSFENGELVRTFAFKNYYQTLAFVNAAAWVAHAEDHHPVMEIEYKTCTVRYSTHSIGGISENDFICAAKLDRLVEAPAGEA